jgi:hypothetical protein
LRAPPQRRVALFNEDAACGAETLVTQNLYMALPHRPDVWFERVTCESLPFSYFEASPAPREDPLR